MTLVTVGSLRPSVQTSNRGTASEASQAQVNTGTATGVYVSPATLQGRIDTDGTLAANSDVKIPSQKAVKTYVDANAGGGGVSGLTAGRVPYAASATSLTDSSSLTWNNTDKKLTVGDAILYAPASQTNIYLVTTSGGNLTSSGVHNVFIGDDLKTGALSSLSDGNVCIGWRAGKSMSASSHYNVYIGTDAGGSTSGASENVGIGYKAIQFAKGEDNVGIGFGAGMRLSSGAYSSACRNNIFIGYYPGSSGAAGHSANDYLDGNNSIFIGAYVSTDAPTESCQINIGNVFFSRNNTYTNPPPYPLDGNAGVYVTSPTARWHVPGSTTSAASLRIPHGTAPSSPNDGDIWTTTAGLFVRINGVTVGPLS